VPTISIEIVGIGTALDLDRETGTLRITKIIPQSPAARAGLAAGLTIQSIDGVPIGDLSLEQCVGLIRGPAGTTVQLEVVDTTRNEASSVQITREKFRT
jgi:carboxyl-terminal processing protease